MQGAAPAEGCRACLRTPDLPKDTRGNSTCPKTYPRSKTLGYVHPLNRLSDSTVEPSGRRDSNPRPLQRHAPGLKCKSLCFRGFRAQSAATSRKFRVSQARREQMQRQNVAGNVANFRLPSGTPVNAIWSTHRGGRSVPSQQPGVPDQPVHISATRGPRWRHDRRGDAAIAGGL